MLFEYSIKGGDFSTAGQASSRFKKVLQQLNVPPQTIKRIVIALYEAEVNIVAHAFEGTINIEVQPGYVVMTLTDKGPGIPDIEKAMEVGYSTASPKVREMGFGAGMGLSNIKNNADSLEIQSKINQGTTLKITVNLNQENVIKE